MKSGVQTTSYHLQKNKLDFLGIVISMLCAIHCLFLPILVNLSAFASLKMLQNPLVEYSIIILSILIASISFIPALRKVHSNLLPIGLLILGFVLFSLSRTELVDIPESFITVSAAIVITVAHISNWVLLRKKSEKKEEHTYS